MLCVLRCVPQAVPNLSALPDDRAHPAGLASAYPGLAKLVCGFIFPVGLTMVTICGAELYTGNTATVTCAVFEKKATWSELVRNWVVSWTGGSA